MATKETQPTPEFREFGKHSTTDDEPEWMAEWIRIGRVLEEHSKPEWWSAKFSELKARADALDVQARELLEMSRVK